MGKEEAIMKTLGKKNSYERGTVMAYACATCFCYCNTCTNCKGSTLQQNGSSILDTVTYLLEDMIPIDAFTFSSQKTGCF